MRAARFYGAGDIRIEDVPAPTPGPSEVLIAPAHNGLCGSDLHEYQIGPLAMAVSPNPLTGAELPVILGHEFSGTVIEVGSAVTTVAVGDRVAVEPIYHCGTCRPCTAGFYNVCPSIAFHGLMATGGGLSELTVVTETMVHRLPDEVSLEQGALVEPMAVARHAVGRSRVRPGESALVLGAGPIGIGTILALRAMGAAPIIVSEAAPHRREIAASLDVEHVLDPMSTDIATVVREITSGGAAVAIDAAGKAATATAALTSLRPRGHAVSVAVYTEPVTVDANVLLGELDWTGALAYTGGDFQAVIADMASGHYPIDGWVDHISLDHLTHGLDSMATGDVVKLLVDLPAPDST